MRKQLIVLWLVFTIVQVGAQPCDAPDCSVTNLLNNGDFESGDLSGWEPTGSGLSIESSEAYQGAFAAHIGQAVQVRQILAGVEVGKTYVASAWFRWNTMTDDD